MPALNLPQEVKNTQERFSSYTHRWLCIRLQPFEEPKLIGWQVTWRLLKARGGAAPASNSGGDERKCLAQSNKSPTGSNATNKRPAARRNSSGRLRVWQAPLRDAPRIISLRKTLRKPTQRKLMNDALTKYVRGLPLRRLLGGFILAIVWLAPSMIEYAYSGRFRTHRLDVLHLLAIFVAPLCVLGFLWGCSERVKLERAIAIGTKQFDRILKRIPVILKHSLHA